MTMITLKQLKFLDALARLGHFGRAAAQCCVSQPALSMQIRELERRLGVTLVERRAQGARLTDAGQEIAKRSRNILSAVRDMTEFASGLGGLLSAPLRLGVIPTVAPYVLPTLLPLLRDRYPNLEVRLRETHTQQLLAELQDGTLDVLLLALPITHPEIETLGLHADRFLLALPTGRRMAKNVRATPDLIKHDTLLLLDEGHCLRDQVLAFCDLRQAEAINTLGTSSLATLVQLVANGMGLTLLPEISVSLEARHRAVKVMRFAEPEPTRLLGLAWRKTSPRCGDFRVLGGLVKTAITTVAASA
jgi:LysR family transcriptional regulator, hydrogen peroxide-inducible genes activator